MMELQVSTIIFTILNLLILYFILKRLLFGRVTRVLEARAEQISQSLSDAEREKRQADELKNEYEQKLTQAHIEAAGILAQAKVRGEQEYQSILGRAQEDALRLQEQAKARSQADREELLRSARGEVAQLTMLAAAKVAQRSLDQDTDRALAEQFLAEAGERK